MSNKRLATVQPASAPQAGASASPTLADARASAGVRLAAIDVGSNSIHMIVAQVDPDGGITTLWRMKEPTGLGRLTFPSRRISPAAMDRAIATLDRFKQAARRRGAEKMIIAATSAVREARNGGDLIERAWRDLRLRIHLVSARDEARLIYLGVRHATCLGDDPTKPHLLIDIGGGSVEFGVGTNERALYLESRKLGAARMTSRFVKNDPPAQADLDALRKHYDRELASVFKSVAPHKPVRIVGTSGTLENIAALCHSVGGQVETGVIEAKAFEKVAARILSIDSAARANLSGLDEGRKDQIVAGVTLVQSILARAGELGLRKIHLCNGALREGILVDYLARKLPKMNVRREIPDPRRRSVLDLCRRCEWHKDHSQQVTRLTLQLFDCLQAHHHLSPLDRELVEYAALLHDIGWHIGGKGHHKHAAYLIRHGRLKDFSAEEVEILANIARYHRKSPPKKKHAEYAALSPRARRTVDVGAALLRLADGLDRSHSAVITDVACDVDDKAVRLTLTTRSDAELEIWGAKRKADWFETVFARAVEFQTR